MRTTLMAVAIALSAIVSKAQTTDEGTAKNHISPLDGIEITTEAQISASHGNTSLWLNANKFGLSSLESTNGYLRATALRPLAIDSGKTFGVGYGLDVVAPFNYTSHTVVHQA